MKFLASQELGRLAKWLRILGFDTVYFRNNNKSSLIITALRENRIVLTRNKILLKDKALKIIFVRSEKTEDQLRQVLDELKIKSYEKSMFSRCVLCNSELYPIDKKKVKMKVPEFVYKTQEEFHNCKECGRTYWKGTHWGNVREVVKGVCS